MTRYIGVDLHRNCFTVCILEGAKSRLAKWQFSNIENFAEKLKPGDEIAVEVTGNTRLFCEVLKDHVSRIVVVNPHQFKVISNSVNKTDNNDAQKLALFLSKGLLPEVRMKDKTHAQIASLTQTRDKLVKLRTVLKNKVNNILSANGINLKKESLSSQKGLVKVLQYSLDSLVELELKILVEQIQSLNKSIEELSRTLKEQGPKLPGHKNISSIKGIGDLGASILLSVIGNVNDFTDEGKLASYFGIVPRISNSNETNRSGRITKRGSKLGRTTLVQCALIAKRYNPRLAEYYERIKLRRGTGKAIIALSRKFLNLIYATLKNNWIFEDFANGVLANGCKTCKAS